jgi:hypothetical protein
MKKTALFLPLVLACLLPARADDAIMPGERVLDISLPFRFGIAQHYWDGNSVWQSAAGPRALSAGLELEYGVVPWLSVFALWPGINMYSQIDGEPGGLFGDLVLGLEGGILGPGAPLPALQTRDMRLGTALRLKAPLPSRDGSAGETDLHLWGTGLKVSWDYIFFPMFYLNAAAEFFYYPRQWANNPNVGGEGRIDLPLELRFELEPHGVFAIKDGFAVLSVGLPFRYHMFSQSSFNGIQEDNDQHRFNIGVSFGALFMTAIPFEINLRYDAPVAGIHDFASHIISLSGTLRLPLPPKKQRPAPTAAPSALPEGSG